MPGLFSVVDGRTTGEWLLDLGDAFSPERRDRAVAALSVGDAEVAGAVVLRIDPSSGTAVAEAQQAVLVLIGAQAVAPLVTELDRRAAWEAPLVAALAAIGAPAVPALEWLASSARHEAYARVRAVRTLAAMRPQPEGVGERLVGFMYAADAPAEVRTAAASGVASWARPWVEADSVGAGLLAASEDRDAEIDRVTAAAEAAGRLGAAAGAAVEAGPAPSGWAARRREGDTEYAFEYFAEGEWTGAVAVEHLDEDRVLRLLRHGPLLCELGPELAAASADAALLERLELNDERAEAAGYRLAPATLAEGAAAAQRLRDLGARLRAERGEGGVEELVGVFADLTGAAAAQRARELLLGGTWVLE
jgi:hypothetical protein